MSQTKKPKAKTEHKTAKHAGKVLRPLRFPALEIKQLDSKMYVFKAKASLLYSSFSINRRIEDKDVGYQRALSPARVQAITRYITQRKKPIPGAVIVCLDKATFDSKKNEIAIPASGGPTQSGRVRFDSRN